MNWKTQLHEHERARLAAMASERKALTEEHRRIYDRCRKRLAKAKASAEVRHG